MDKYKANQNNQGYCKCKSHRQWPSIQESAKNAKIVEAIKVKENQKEEKEQQEKGLVTRKVKIWEHEATAEKKDVWPIVFEDRDIF